MTIRLIFLTLFMAAFGCVEQEAPKKEPEVKTIQTSQDADTAAIEKEGSESVTPATAAEILAKTEVPILCYHQLREYKPTDSKVARDYIVPPAIFIEQMQTLKDSGYSTILPDDLYNYLTYGKSLPAKPVMITFDDTDLEQYTVGKPEMEKRGFKGVFFIMTVSIGRPRYMSSEQIKDLADKGHVIASHTWDHHNVKKYQGDDWKTQLEKPTRQLQEITGKKIEYFAYPFGLWNPEAIPNLKSRGFKAAFQLYSKMDENDPLYTIRRIIITGDSRGGGLIKRMRTAYHLN